MSGTRSVEVVGRSPASGADATRRAVAGISRRHAEIGDVEVIEERMTASADGSVEHHVRLRVELPAEPD